MSTRIIEVKSCDNCPYKTDDDWNDAIYCGHKRETEYRTIDNHPFPAWCPLPEMKVVKTEIVEVPDHELYRNGYNQAIEDMTEKIKCMGR